MGTPALAVALVGAGIVAAFLGLLISMVRSRHRHVVESGPAVHADAGLVVLVSGLVVAILGAGDWVFLLLTSG